MGAIGTGIMVTAEELAGALCRQKTVQETPVMRVHGIWLHEAAQESLQASIDALAVKYGLPLEKDADGDVIHYGLKGTGELLKWDGAP